jgi:RND family efflux transporter MFP subunit
MAGITWTNRWKLWTSALLVAAILVSTFVLLSSGTSVPTVQVVRATRAVLDSHIDSNGKVEPIDPQVFRAQTETFINGILAKEGQPIHRGQVVLTLNAIEIRANLAQARLDLLGAQDDLRRARAGGAPDEEAQLTGDLRRAQLDVEHSQHRQEILQGLLADHASTQDEVDQNAQSLARAQVLVEMLQKKQREFASRAAVLEKSALLRVQQSQDRIHLLESQLVSTTVISPINGTLYSEPVRLGDYVQVGQLLAEMADLHKMRLRAFVDEADLGGLLPDQPVTITWEAMPYKTWTGRTEEIPKRVVDRGTRSVGEVLCSVDNNELALLPNVNVDVRILVRERRDAVVVPRGAVHTDQSKHFVYLLERDGRLRRREVSIGIASSSGYEVLSGLDEGDRLAVSNNVSLRDGTAVRADEQQ